MEQLFDLETYEGYLESGRTWVVDNAVTFGVSGVAQIIVVGLALLAARLVAARAQGLWPGACWSAGSPRCRT